MLTQIRRVFYTAFIVLLFSITESVSAQEFNTKDTLHLSLDQAVSIALESNFGVQREQLAIKVAEQQVKEAWGSVYPQIQGSASYTRNIVTANPFAGSDAGGLFQTLGALDWIAYNENARQDGDPNTEPISFQDFMDRQAQGYEDAGLSMPSMDDNPFGVDNQFVGAISITQALFNGSAFAAIRGAEQFQQVSRDGFERQLQVVIDEVRTSYYQALLAQQSVNVLEKSVDRLKKTVRDARRAAEQGVVSRADRLSAEVELVNLETQLIEVKNGAKLAVQALSMTMGIPVNTNIVLDGELRKVELPENLQLNPDDAFLFALENRPDLKQLEGLVRLQEAQKEITRSQYFPVVNAFADFGYLGSVPDNRTQVFSVEGDPFTFSSTERSFFHDSYWNANFAAGIQVSFTIFNGFQTRARVQQAQLAIKEAELNSTQMQEAVQLEINDALNNLMTAQQRIQSQARNIEQAELNYEFANRRLQEGAGTALEERNASQLLDQSNLNYLNALHDYLVALSRLELALGKSVDNIAQELSYQ